MQMSRADFFVQNHKKMQTTTTKKTDEQTYVPESNPNWEIHLLKQLTGLTAQQIIDSDLPKQIRFNKILMFFSCL
jgi:hypothetical protein